MAIVIFLIDLKQLTLAYKDRNRKAHLVKVISFQTVFYRVIYLSAIPQRVKINSSLTNSLEECNLSLNSNSDEKLTLKGKVLKFNPTNCFSQRVIRNLNVKLKM